MAHEEQLAFVELVSDCLPMFFRGSRVIEVGSLDINGTVRKFFTDCSYTGLDVAPGPGVDLVCQGQDYDGPTESFDTVISCEAMEHNPYWQETFKNMVRLCKGGGLVLMTCATTGRREHGTTRSESGSSPNTVNLGWEYYRNLVPGDFKAAFDLDKLFIQHRFFSNWRSFDLYFCGIARGAGADARKAGGWNICLRKVDAWLKPYNSARRSRYRKAIARLLGDRSFVWQRTILSRLEYWLG
jgi:SAM-dependent methyltransferase